MPFPYEAVTVGRARLMAAPDALATAVRALEQAGTLYDHAATHGDGSRLAGRGPVYGVETPTGRWVVRHYRRGGQAARWLDDRYLSWGTPRPFRELEASDAARRRGVATPRVVAAAVYPAGAFYRGDLATELIGESADLAHILFGTESLTAAERLDACAAAARLLRALPDRGVVHPDLNLKNILLRRSDHTFEALLLDLDGCRVMDRATPAQRERMRRRFLRSLEKWQRRTGRRLSPSERAALDGGSTADDAA